MMPCGLCKAMHWRVVHSGMYKPTRHRWPTLELHAQKEERLDEMEDAEEVSSESMGQGCAMRIWEGEFEGCGRWKTLRERGVKKGVLSIFLCLRLVRKKRGSDSRLVSWHAFKMQALACACSCKCEGNSSG
eukprot:scaffold13932_cov22-Tisochrysis_lutea.AAC.1